MPSFCHYGTFRCKFTLNTKYKYSIIDHGEKTKRIFLLFFRSSSSSIFAVVFGTNDLHAGATDHHRQVAFVQAGYIHGSKHKVNTE